MNDGFSVSIHETMTGNFLTELDAASGTWGTSITSPGSGQHVFKLDDGQFTRDEWRDLTSHWSRTIVHRWNGWPIYAGLIIRRDWNVTTSELTVSHAELRNIFARRLPFAVGDPDGVVFAPNGSTIATNRSFPAVVRQIVLAGISGAGFEMPIVLPGDGSGSYSNEWKNWSFPTIEDMLSDVEKTDGGPDIHFTPEYDGNLLRWVLRVGNPRLTAATYEWNVHAKATESLGLTVIEDGAKMLTGVFAIGNGSEADMQVGGARSIEGPTVPFMDSSRSYKTEVDRAKLNAFALAELKTFRSPTLQTGFSAKASQTENLSNIIPGSILKLYWQGDYFMPDGWQSNYLMGMSGSLEDTINFEVQPA